MSPDFRKGWAAGVAAGRQEIALVLSRFSDQTRSRCAKKQIARAFPEVADILLHDHTPHRPARRLP